MSTLADGFTLDEALSIIHGTSLSRAAVETSTPEQIVWITADRIADGFRMKRLGVQSERDRIESAARRAVERSGMAPRTAASFLKALEREMSEWPS